MFLFESFHLRHGRLDLVQVAFFLELRLEGVHPALVLNIQQEHFGQMALGDCLDALLVGLLIGLQVIGQQGDRAKCQGQDKGERGGEYFHWLSPLCSKTRHY